MRCCDGNKSDQKKRSVTSLSLEWIAKKVRRANFLRDKIHQGHYNVDTEKVAKSILNGE